MPKDERYLTDATRDTLTDNVKLICVGWNKADGYLYEILREEKADPFAPFLAMYKGVLKSGVSTCHFDNELEFAKARYTKAVHGKEPAECFTEKLNVQNLTMSKFIESLADGDLDLEEIKALEICLDRERRNIAVIEKMLSEKKAQLTAIIVDAN